MAVATSFNGLAVLGDYPGFSFTAPGWKVVYVRSRPAAVILEAWARRWHAEIEPIARSHRDNWHRPRERHSRTKSGAFDLIGIHSYRPPGTKVGTGNQSNHRSGSAIDINGHLHPYEATTPAGKYRDGFTQAQRDAVRAIAASARDADGKSIGRSGLDFARGKRDGMHLEIAPGVSEDRIAAEARRFEDEVGVRRPPTSGSATPSGTTWPGSSTFLLTPASGWGPSMETPAAGPTARSRASRTPTA